MITVRKGKNVISVGEVGQILSVQIIEDGIPYDLYPTKVDAFRYYDKDIRGTPVCFALYHKEIRIWPIPDRDVLVRVVYYPPAKEL